VTVARKRKSAFRKCLTGSRQATTGAYKKRDVAKSTCQKLSKLARDMSSNLYRTGSGPPSRCDTQHRPPLCDKPNALHKQEGIAGRLSNSAHLQDYLRYILAIRTVSSFIVSGRKPLPTKYSTTSPTPCCVGWEPRYLIPIILSPYLAHSKKTP